MAHEPRLLRELRNLLKNTRVAALGTTQDDGSPFVSMVPFALEAQQRCVVIHVSGLAAHSRYMLTRNQVSLLVTAPVVPGDSVHDLPRVTLQGSASVTERGSAAWNACKAAYLGRFPEAQHMTELGDFRFVAIEPNTARHISGFGPARTVDREELTKVLGGSN
jgi:putative heme iron utilization protein